MSAAIDWDIVTHTDVVCPPSPDAVCRHCGGTLAHHSSTEGPEESPTPATAICIDPLAFAEYRAIRYRTFELADGESLDCTNVGDDPVCGIEICSEHSNEFATCADNSAVLHHLDCRHRCIDCADAMADDAKAGDRS